MVVRSTWDYWDDVAAFLRVLEEIDAETRLANPLPLLRWNLSKQYLRDLEGKGVPIVPTQWCDRFHPRELQQAEHLFGTPELVLKPQVGGNGQGVMRLKSDAISHEHPGVLDQHTGRPCMIQPFREAIQSEGEWSLFAFLGQFSHAIRKHPAVGEFRSQEERGAAITAAVPSDRLLEAMTDCLAALPLNPLYARVDLIDSPGIGVELVELELVEPSLYFRMDPGAPTRFSLALERWFADPSGNSLG